jgi:hypothetical protein
LSDIGGDGEALRVLDQQNTRAEKLISPAAPISSFCSSPRRKNNPLYENRKQWIISVIPLPLGGRIAIVTDVGSGMRWTCEWRETNAVCADG